MAKALHSRRLPFVAALLLSAIIPAQSQSNSPPEAWTMLCASTHAKPSSRCTTIAIEYVGKTDRPVFPIVISTSPDEAEWCKQLLFSDPVSTFAGVYIVGKSTMKEIADIPLPNGDLKRPSSDVGPRTSPALLLVLATGHDFKEVTVEATGSALLLREIKKRVSEYQPLIERLDDIEGRMNRYLKQSRSL